MLSFTNKRFRKSWGHQLLVLKENTEEFLSQDREVLLFKKLRINLTQLIELRVNLILWDWRFVSNQILQLSDLGLIFLLQVLNVLLRNLNVTLELKNVNQVLSLVSELLFKVIDLIWSSWVLEVGKNIEEHSVLIRLLHDFSYLIIEVHEETSSWMIDNVQEWFKANTTFSNISIEQSNTNNDVWQFAQLGNLLRCSKRNKRSETSSWQNWLECCSDLSFNSIWNGSIEGDWRVVTNNVLLVLVEQVVENLFVKKGDALKIISRPWLEWDDFINESIWFMTQICDVLLSLNFLFYICRIVTDLQFYRI